MIVVAYVFFIVAVVAYVRGLILPVARRFELLARAFGAVAGVGFLSVALLLLGNGPPTAVGAVVLLILAIGAGVYVWGLVRWGAPDGFVLRRTGWFLLVAALALPTMLTLLMPVACLLVLTLRSAAQPQTAFAGFNRPVRR